MLKEKWHYNQNQNVQREEKWPLLKSGLLILVDFVWVCHFNAAYYWNVNNSVHYVKLLFIFLLNIIQITPSQILDRKYIYCVLERFLVVVLNLSQRFWILLFLTNCKLKFWSRYILVIKNLSLNIMRCSNTVEGDQIYRSYGFEHPRHYLIILKYSKNESLFLNEDKYFAFSCCVFLNRDTFCLIQYDDLFKSYKLKKYTVPCRTILKAGFAAKHFFRNTAYLAIPFWNICNFVNV